MVGDKFAGLWPVETFAKFNILYEQSAAPKSDLYRDLLPVLNSRRAELLDHPKLFNQLVSLERRTGRGGKDSIDHPPGAAYYDDLANACAGVIVTLINQTVDYLQFCKAFNGEREGEDPDESWRRWRYNVFLESHGLIRI